MKTNNINLEKEIRKLKMSREDREYVKKRKEDGLKYILKKSGHYTISIAIALWIIALFKKVKIVMSINQALAVFTVSATIVGTSTTVIGVKVIAKVIDQNKAQSQVELIKSSEVKEAVVENKPIVKPTENKISTNDVKLVEPRVAKTIITVLNIENDSNHKVTNIFKEQLDRLRIKNDSTAIDKFILFGSVKIVSNKLKINIKVIRNNGVILLNTMEVGDKENYRNLVYKIINDVMKEIE